jgi:hypothetical protein
MTWRDHHLPDILPCPQYRAHAATPVGERNTRAAVTGDLRMMTDQDALGASNRGDPQEKSQMACEPHEPRMGQALPVAHDQIRNTVQSAESSQKWG